jgi:Zn-dependent peptidase ImmA (M78 family)
MIGLIHPGRVQADVAKTAALAILKKYNIQVPPVPAEQIIKKEGWQLSYFSTSQYPDFANEEGFCRLNEGRYYLYLNAELPAGRDVWTYAHETAHIVLKHHELYDTNDLTKHENWLLDREADIFAANYLMPEEWIFIRTDSRQICLIADIYDLKTQFGVSWEAMIIRLDELSVQSKNLTHSIFNHRRKLLQQDGLIIEVDSNMRFLSCPGCRGRNISDSASYCKICGTYLFNDCTNPDCGRHNTPDARYCECCGAETILFQEGLLTAARKPRGYGEKTAGEKRKAPNSRINLNGAAKKGGFTAS